MSYIYDQEDVTDTIKNNVQIGQLILKVNGNNYPKVFQDSKDQFKSFTLGVTDYDAFTKLYGAGMESVIDTEDTMSGKAVKLTYDWGTACFTDVGRVLYDITTTNPSMSGPRGSKVGMRLSDLTAPAEEEKDAASPEQK